MFEARDLYSLQKIEQEIARTRQSLDEATRRLGETEELKTARLAAEQGRGELQDLEKKKRAAEYELADTEGKLSVQENELYSGRIRNPKELMNLEREVRDLRAKKDKLETEVLGLMEALDMKTAALKELEEHYFAVERAWQEAQDNLKAEIALMEHKFEELGRRRGEVASSIDPGVLALYEDIKRRSVVAVARVERGVCLGCHLDLTLADLQKVRSGEITRCSHCGRILYLE